MKNTTYTTPMLPGFRRQIRRRKPHAAQRKFARKAGLAETEVFQTNRRGL